MYYLKAIFKGGNIMPDKAYVVLYSSDIITGLKVMIGKKSANAHTAVNTRGYGCLPGGTVNGGETFAMAAQREFREETGINYFVLANPDQLFSYVKYRYRGDALIQTVRVYFLEFTYIQLCSLVEQTNIPASNEVERFYVADFNPHILFRLFRHPELDWFIAAFNSFFARRNIQRMPMPTVPVLPVWPEGRYINN